MKKRFRIIFEGLVQGVGFRYTAYHKAASLGLTGFVKNEWNGSVLMEAQGDEEVVENLINAMSEGRFIHIDSITKDEIPLIPNERSFRIEY